MRDVTIIQAQKEGPVFHLGLSDPPPCCMKKK
jgi:hypothetical protein